MAQLLSDPILQFKNNVSLEKSEHHAYLKTTYNTLNIDQLTPGLVAAIQLLCNQGATEEELSDLILQTDGFSGLPRFYFYLDNFIRFNIINYTICVHGSPLAKIAPISSDFSFDFANLIKKEFDFSEQQLNQTYILSRFTYCRKEEKYLVLESPLSHFQIILLDWRGAAIISELSQPKKPDQISNQIPGISEEISKLFLQLLLNAKMIWEIEKDGKIPEIENQNLCQWEFHDLLFHTRSRVGRNLNPLTLSYRFLGEIEPLPALKPQMSNDVIDLYKPDIEKLKQTDISFTQTLETRKSIRSHGEQPITDKQLGEFLYRAARIRDIFKTKHEELSNRPYPSMGACYELELYVTVNSCEQIHPGLYHYQPLAHQLSRISTNNQTVEELLNYAWLHAHGYYFYEQTNHISPNKPQILIIIAARFPRAAWAYESLAYAQILKNVGVLFQTMYLVATSMELAACAQSGGNSDLFAQAIGSDYYAETSVGEFILGSQPHS